MLLAAEASHKSDDSPGECRAKATEIGLFSPLDFA
jgi:hypothetical protein